MNVNEMVKMFYKKGVKKEAVSFSEMKGETILEIHGLEKESTDVIFVTDKHYYLMTHQIECCEWVDIESVVGDVGDLIGSELLMAEESVNSNLHKCQTWTFYKLATIKGYVDIRWFGESNGYYSESVDFYRIERK